MLKKEINNIELSVENPYEIQLVNIPAGIYRLRIIHQSRAVFDRPRSLFFTFDIPGLTPQEIRDLLGLKDISAQNGVFAYTGGGEEKAGFYVQEVEFRVNSPLEKINIQLHSFLALNILVDYFHIEEKENINNLGSNYVIENNATDCFSSDNSIIFNDLSRGHYTLIVDHKNKKYISNEKDLFVTFHIPNLTPEETKKILGLSYLSDKFGCFAYIGAGKKEGEVYRQKVELRILGPIKELKVKIRTYTTENIIVDSCTIEEENISDFPLVFSHSITKGKNKGVWISNINDKDLFFFKKYISDELEGSQSVVLGESPVGTTIDVKDCSGLFCRIKLEARDKLYDSKQAIITFQYLTEDNKPILDQIDAPYSLKLEKNYYYLNVDPSKLNNIYLPIPAKTDSVKLEIHLWDNYSDILFDNSFYVETYRKGVSVILPSYKGEKTILRCLESLSSQTLPYEEFEIIIALNGERDETRNLVETFLLSIPQLNVRVLELDKSGAGYARNQALSKAIFDRVTFIDDDDFVDNNYLYNLLEKSSWDNLTLTGVVDINDSNQMASESHIMEQLVNASKKPVITYNDVTSLLTMNACKILPTYMAKRFQFKQDLKSGEDVVYWTEILTKFQPALYLSNDFNQSVYYRVITDNSVSRQQESYDFNVLQRLDVIQYCIELLPDTNSQLALKAEHNFVQSKINAQANFIKNYLKNNPEDYDLFIQEVQARELDNLFIKDINKEFTDRLVISYCFAPYADTSAVVMCKRINQMDVPVDVISNNMDKVRSKDESLEKLILGKIGRHIELDTPQSFSGGEPIIKFSETVVKKVGNIISQRPMYKEIYSRTMWPASHFAAALLKIKFPHIKWVAEFSDPILKDVTGKNRYSQISLSWLKQHGLLDKFSEETNDNLFYWCERIVYELADEIVFTNKNQKDYMASYATSYKEKINSIHKIIPQPTLPEKYYELSNIELKREPNCIYIGYFGSMYVNRGFDVFFRAWEELPAIKRERIKFLIYTQQPKKLVLNGIPNILINKVEIIPYVNYISFLTLTKQFDCLLVMDAQVEDGNLLNPYLPSKISDYAGSNNSILALVEEYSPMSQMNLKNLFKIKISNFEKIIEFMEGQHF